jgi:hypothetical protein
MLQYDVTVTSDLQKTPLPGVALLLCDVTAVAKECLLRQYLGAYLGFQQTRHNIINNIGLCCCFKSITVWYKIRQYILFSKSWFFVLCCVKCLITMDYEIIGHIVTNNLNYKLEYSHNIYFFIKERRSWPALW